MNQQRLLPTGIHRPSMLVLPILALCFAAGGQSVLVHAMMTTPGKTKNYDVVIIGGGAAGLTAAKIAAMFGKTTVIVEQHRMGGDCTWTGCVPSKSLIAAAKAAHTMKTAQEQFGIGSHVPLVDMKQVKAKIRDKMQRIYEEDDSPEAMAKLGIDTIVGQTATFVDARTIALTPAKVATASTTPNMLTVNMGTIICTGAKPRIPSSIRGLSDVPFLTYEQIFDLEELPTRMTVVGGGPIGCEIAQAFARLGSKVTQVANVLVPKEEPEISQALEDLFAAEGIERIRGRIVQVAKQGRGHVATYQMPNGSTGTVQGDVLLCATGRIPNTQGLGLDTVGVETKSANGGIVTNTQMKTNVKHIYAAGDCTGDAQFTHYAGLQGGIAARNIVLPFSDRGTREPEEIPSATFTSPEISSIGLTEAQAVELHGKVKVGVSIKRMEEVDRAVCEGTELHGLIKIVYHTTTFQILGASAMAPVAGELIAEIGVAMKANMPFDKLSSVTHAYPTYAMALQLMATDLLYDKTLKMKRMLNVLKKIGL